MLYLEGYLKLINDNCVEIIDKIFNKTTRTGLIVDVVKDLFELKSLIDTKLMLLLAITKQYDKYREDKNEEQIKKLEEQISLHHMEDAGWKLYDKTIDSLNNDEMDDKIDIWLDSDRYEKEENVNDVILSDISQLKRDNEILKQICKQFDIFCVINNLCA